MEGKLGTVSLRCLVLFNLTDRAAAFQTAVALAEAEEMTDEPEGQDGKKEEDEKKEKDEKEKTKLVLKVDHIRSIVKMSGAFKKYLNTLHQGDETQRAARDGLRIDDYEEGKDERERMGHYV